MQRKEISSFSKCGKSGYGDKLFTLLRHLHATLFENNFVRWLQKQILHEWATAEQLNLTFIIAGKNMFLKLGMNTNFPLYNWLYNTMVLRSKVLL